MTITSLITSIGERMTWCANLDVLNNQRASDENYLRLQELLAAHAQIRTKLLWIYQCQSRGDHLAPTATWTCSSVN